MKKVLLVLTREYLVNVRTKAFLIGVFLTPLWFGLAFVVPGLARQQQATDQQVLVVDGTGDLGDAVADALDAMVFDGKKIFAVKQAKQVEDLDALKAEIAEGELLAVLLDPSVLEKPEPPPQGILHPNSLGGRAAAARIQAAVNAIVNERVMAAEGISKEDAARLARDAIRGQALSRGGGVGSEFQTLLPLLFMMALYFGIVGISQILVNSTIEEKASRVYELLLSSLSPTQLMAGKVLGICLVGFTLLVLWIGGGLLAAGLQGVGGMLTVGQLLLFAVYYVLGFLLIASLMVAVGSACNTQKEAQNLMAPISILLALPLMLAILILKDPNGTLATLASFFPPFTPFLMMARISAVPGPPTWQIAASLLLLVAATAVAIFLAGRIFRVGILMVGKPPTLREILRWMGES